MIQKHSFYRHLLSFFKPKENQGILAYSWVTIIVGALLLAVAASVRLPAVSMGLPYEYGWDEPEIMLPAIRLLRDGVYIPYKFDYGPLNGYTHAAWGALTFVRGLSKGQFTDGIWGIQSDNSTGWYWTVTSSYLLKYGRVLSALLGMFSVLMIYMSGLKLWGRILPAAVAAGIIATNGIFAAQTSLVSADATTIAAVCLSIWASIHILKDRSQWAYITAGVAVAAAAAYKYNNVFIALLPVLAHFLSRPAPTADRPPTVPLVRYFLYLAVAFALMMFPVFLRPTNFLHSLSTLLSYYVEPIDSTIFTQLIGYFKRGLALLDMGQVTSPGRELKSVSQLTFQIGWTGVCTVALVIAGVVAAAVTNRRLLLFLAPVIACNFINVGGDSGYFFTRYLLLSLPLLALFGGYAIVTALRYWPGHVHQKLVQVSFCVLLLTPTFVNALEHAIEAKNKVDPRTQMSQFVIDNVSPGSRIIILDETRWHASGAELSKFKLTKLNAMQLQQHPDILTKADYMIAPRSVYFHSANQDDQKLAESINNQIAQFTAAKKYGSAPIALNGPDVEPAVQLIKLSNPNPAGKASVPQNVITGMAFMSSNASGTVLCNGNLGMRSGVSVAANCEITKESKTITVNAQGSAPYRQNESPSLEIIARQLPIDVSSTPVTRSISLDRSQSGMNDYVQPFVLAPGQYEITVKARDSGNYLIRLGKVSFQ